MKKLFLTLFLIVVSTQAQTNQGIRINGTPVFGGSPTNCLVISSTNKVGTIACSAGGGVPGGSNTQVQRNNAGSFGGITGATSDGTNLSVTTQTTGDGTTKAASDAFVANALQSINPATNVQVSTTTILPNTPAYANGTAGVGATLTAGSNTTLAAIDGYTVQLNDRILVQNQVSTLQDGVYTLTATGSGGAPWVLTRAADYNGVTNINYTGFICTIQTGSMYAGDTCFLLANLITAVGTSPITYNQQPTGANAGKPGGGVQIIGPVTTGDALKVAAGNSGKSIQDAGVAFSSLTQTIASGTLALNTTAVSANTCGAAQTASATGTATTDAIAWIPNADITAVTGYNVAGTFGLYMFAYPTTNTFNVKVCNSTSSSITPGSAITLNFRVTR